MLTETESGYKAEKMGDLFQLVGDMEDGQEVTVEVPYSEGMVPSTTSIRSRLRKKGYDVSLTLPDMEKTPHVVRLKRISEI